MRTKKGDRQLIDFMFVSSCTAKHQNYLEEAKVSQIYAKIKKKTNCATYQRSDR